MMKTVRKWISVVMAAALCVSVLAGCTRGEESSPSSSAEETVSSEISSEVSSESSAESSAAISEGDSTDSSADTSIEDSVMSSQDSSEEESSEEESSRESSSSEASESDSSAGQSSAASSETSSAVSESGSQSSASSEPVDLKVAALKGPTALGMLGIMDKAEKQELTDSITFTLASSPDEILGDIIQGNYDIAALPANVAAVLYKKTEGRVLMLGINTLGVFYILTNDETVTSLADLKGRTIVTTGQGSTPEYALNYILTQNGLIPGTDVTIEYKSESAEVASAVAAGEADIVMLPQPFVTVVLSQNEGWRMAIDLNEEWDKVSGGSSLVSGCVVVQKDLVESNPEAIVRFLQAYEESVSFVNANPEEAGTLAEHFDIIKASVATQAIPYCHIVLITGDEMEQKASGYFKVLYDADPSSVGSSVPDSAFYYKVSLS